MRRFPYSIIYYVRDDELRVVAIAHLQAEARLLGRSNVG